MLKSRFNLAERPSNATADEVEGEDQDKAQDLKQYEQLGEGGEFVEEVYEEEKTVYPRRAVNSGEVSARLSFLGKTGTGDGYAYLKATLTKMNLTDLSTLKAFKHLQYVDVSNNNLELDALQVLAELPYLVLIHADHNALQSAALKRMEYLQVIIMNNNNISSVHDVYQPELSTLELGYNKIRKIKFDNRMPHIKVLDFRYNIIEDISDLDFPNLVSLYLAGNKITSLIGLERLVNLRILHVRNNPIKLLNGFHENLTKLQYINLRNCKVGTLKQVKNLRILKALDTIVMKGCPYMGGTGEEDVPQEEEEGETRVEMIAALPRLKRINKAVVTPEERAEAKELMTQWLEEGEKDEEELEDEHQESFADD